MLFSGVWEVTRMGSDGVATSEVVHFSPTADESTPISGAVFAGGSGSGGGISVPIAQWMVSVALGGSALHGTLLETRGGKAAEALCEFDFAPPPAATRGMLISASADCAASFSGARLAESFFSKPNLWAETGASFFLTPKNGGASLHAARIKTVAAVVGAVPKTFLQEYSWVFNIFVLLFANFYIRACTRKRIRQAGKAPDGAASKKAAIAAHMRNLLVVKAKPVVNSVLRPMTGREMDADLAQASKTLETKELPKSGIGSGSQGLKEE